MDGNRRWAVRQGLRSFFGHKKGLEVIHTVVDFCLTHAISHLSLYTFSIENMNSRSVVEKDYLFGQLAQEAAADLDTFKQKNVRMQFVGDRTLFPESIHDLIEKIEKETAHCAAVRVYFLLCYGSRQEIADTAKRLAQQVMHGTLSLHDITPDVFEHNLWTTTMPSPDLIIRTGGQHRLSNFLLFQGAYSELYFLDCMWPDISESDLKKALLYYQECQQNFGR
jgi:undecaprenyl diphosphate synthase